MTLAVIGASGSIGRAITHMIVAERLLDSRHTLMLVGNEAGKSAKSLYGLSEDIRDAYAEICPQIEVVLNEEELDAEYIIMAGSAPARHPDQVHDRDHLAALNYQLFDQYAGAIARNGHGHEIVVCVSNPVELAVFVFAKHLGRRRVVGMGAFLDSLRFRKELSLDLGIDRNLIHAFMAGEHGSLMVPLWSSVHAYGMGDDEVAAAIQRIRRGHLTVHFAQDFSEASGRLKELIHAGQIRQAYAFVETYPPDLRVALRPLVTQFSGAKTIAGTARATLNLLRMVMLGHDALISGQICLEGDCYGLHGAVGVPFVIGNKGVDRYIEMRLWPEELEMLQHAAERIRQKYQGVGPDY